MQPDVKTRLSKYLYDVLIAAEELAENTSNKASKEYSFSNTKWIAERGIEIINEALKRATQIEQNLQISDIKKIFSTRHKVAHEYDLVDPFIVYNIVQKNIPTLIKELKAYIETLETN